jgi:alkanesulfonate monooxygenase SsuD/methylene tetrahydromethanopterin reductase-like flavin-dependent oxidoreductase (luciferase family)
MVMPPPRTRIDRLIEAVEVVKGLIGGGPFTFDGEYHRAGGARNLPAAVQQPRPRVFIGGKGDRLLRTVAHYADGWNTCWTWTVDDYRERLSVLERACDEAGRDPAGVWRTLGLYALCGEDEQDLAARFERLRDATPPGVLDGVTLAEFRRGRLVGTVEQVKEQLSEWESVGVDTIVLGAGAVPFQVGSRDDVEALLHACVASN